MSVQSLLPPNGKPFLRAYEQAVAYEPHVVAGIELIPHVKGRELPDWLKFLLYEYGLIELTNYVPSAYVLLEEGRLWQIERDTWAAVERGLGWVDAPGTIVEAPARRNWWNNFQLYLQSLPAADTPNLDRIDRVTELGKPFRSDFRRGVFGYDAPAAETDTTVLDACLLDRESGVRTRTGGPLWSFGRAWELNHVLTKAEGQALGNWIERISDAAWLVNFITGDVEIGEEVDPTLEDATNFSRSGPKVAQALDGSWVHFDADEIAITDRGVLLEPETTRYTQFWLDENPVEDDLAAEILATGLADPLGGTDAMRVRFSDDGWLLYVPAEGLLPDTDYAVSFFAKLVSTTGTGISGGGSLVSFFPQLVSGQWVRIEGTLHTQPVLDGDWLDLSLLAPGAEVVIELGGFQVELGTKVTSPVLQTGVELTLDGDPLTLDVDGLTFGPSITGTRAADMLTIVLPGEDAYNLTISFDVGSAQPLLGVVGDTEIEASALTRSYVTEIGSLRVGTWDSMAFPWDDADFPWNGDAATTRARTLAAWFEEHAEAHFRLKAAGGAVIGYRRARVVRQVSPVFNGPFSFETSRFQASEEGTTVLIEAMTDAGNGAGQAVANIDLILGGNPAVGIPAGRLWKGPSQLGGGTPIAPKSLSIPLRATVRERLKLMLRF